MRGDLAPFAQDLKDDGGGRKRERGADENRRLGVGAQEPRKGAERQARDRDLRRAQAEDVEPHDLEALKRKLKADGEQKKHYPELGKAAGRLHVVDDAETERPDQRPGDEIAQNRARAQAPEQRHHQDRGDEKNQNGGQERGVGHGTHSTPV